MAIFNCYVSSPEGISSKFRDPQSSTIPDHGGGFYEVVHIIDIQKYIPT